MNLSRFIDADPGLASLLQEVRGRLDADPGHDVAHCLRVALWTIKLGGDVIDPRCAVAAFSKTPESGGHDVHLRWSTRGATS